MKTVLLLFGSLLISGPSIASASFENAKVQCRNFDVDAENGNLILGNVEITILRTKNQIVLVDRGSVSKVTKTSVPGEALALRGSNSGMPSLSVSTSDLSSPDVNGQTVVSYGYAEGSGVGGRFLACSAKGLMNIMGTTKNR